MPVLGCGGKLLLKREAPDPCVIRPGGFDWNSNTVDLECYGDGYWTGDRICLQAPDGLPILDNGVPGTLDGVATYFGSTWFLGPNRDHIDANDDEFYKQGTEDYPDGQENDAANFYFIGGDTNGDGTIDDNDLITDRCYYIHVDELGRISFYDTRCEALLGDPDDRVDLQPLSFDYILIGPCGSQEYQNALWACYQAIGDYLESDIQENLVVPIDSICDHPPDYELPENTTSPEYGNAQVNPRGSKQGNHCPYWQIMCGIKEWTLELDAPSVDTTAVGEKFGEAVKSLVTGGGSIDFFVEKQCCEEEIGDGLLIMQLLLMTEKGSKAHAEFYLIDRGASDTACDTRTTCGDCGDLPGSLYYSTDILVTRNAINMRPTDLVAMTGNFVTTGEIKLLATPD
jgi:hypothetical protein